jgi:hypothetical protein
MRLSTSKKSREAAVQRNELCVQCCSLFDPPVLNVAEVGNNCTCSENEGDTSPRIPVPHPPISSLDPWPGDHVYGTGGMNDM